MKETSLKKIVIVSPAYPYRGGPATYVSYLYRALSSRFDVKIFNYTLLYPDFLFPGTTQYDESKSSSSKVPNERLINSISPFNWIKAASRIKKENADLVVFDWWQPFFGPCHFTISLLLRKQYKGRILFITENYISHESRLIDSFLTRLGLSNADIFLALSDIVALELKKIASGRKIYRSVLPPFDCYIADHNYDRNTSRKELNLSDNDKVLLFFGYVRKYKGLDLLISALPAALTEIPGLKLLVVGEFYDDVSSYSHLIEKLGLTGNVMLLNKFVPNEEVGKYYTASDAVVLPYRSATQSAVLNVSYSFRKPVIATNVGGLGEFIKDNYTGIVVEPGSPEEIAKGIIHFYQVIEKINFGFNIEEYLAGGDFNKLPELFDQIILDSDQPAQ
jgi:glycosyltransferase involved in cell wall biosynthesis